MIRVPASFRAGLARARLLRGGVGALAAALVLAIAPALPPAAVLAHGADPALGGSIWAQDQSVPYYWSTWQTPPPWLQDAFNAAIGDANRSRASRSAIFYPTNWGSPISYGEPTGCGPGGLACFASYAPSWFQIWYRADGYWFDWGQLRWCQASGWTWGCYDAENVGLDELGHVLGLQHHQNVAGEADYGDAVVQARTRAYPQAYSTAHAFGRCDQARLQLLYERPSSWSAVSSCLALTSETGIGVSSTSVAKGGVVLFYGSLRVSTTAAAGAMTGDWVSGRTLVLERRFLGGGTWAAVATMAPQSVDGSYAVTASITGTHEWRVRYSQPSGDGLLGSASVAVPIYMQSCSACPGAMTTSSADR